MALKTFVKISKIDNLSDARYCAGMMVDILGFNLEEGTDGFVSMEKFKEITDWVAGVKFCGEFASALPAEIKLAASNYGIDYIEVQNINHLEELSNLDQGLILKLIIHHAADIKALKSKINYATDFVDYIVLYSLDPSLTNAIYLELLQIATTTPVLRGYDLSEASAPGVADEPVFHGIELEGSPEDRPGFKDYGTVMDILEVLEED